MREQIWSALNNTKFKGYCLELIVEKFQKRDRNINIFLALTSSGSIATWAIWNKYTLVWASIIAVSQIFNVIKPYFPYFKYVKELNSKTYRIETLNIEFERLWYLIQNNKIDEDDYIEKYFDLKKQLAEVLKFNDDTIFNVTDKIEIKANHKMKIFMKNDYNIQLDINN